MKKQTWIVLALLASTASVGAQEVTPQVAPATGATIAPAPVDPFYDRGSMLPAALVFFQTQGTDLVSLGEVGGLKAYLAQGANGRHQVVYALPDGDHVVAGTMFDAQGRNVTSVQLGRMMERFAVAAGSAGLGDVPRPDLAATTPEPEGDFVRRYRDDGYVVTALGKREGGVDAFLVQAAAPDESGRRLSQVFYVAPDARYAVAGIAVRKDGMMVTGLQLAAFRQNAALVAATRERGGSTIEASNVNKPSAPEAAFDPAPAAQAAVATPSVSSDEDVLTVPPTQNVQPAQESGELPSLDVLMNPSAAPATSPAPVAAAGAALSEHAAVYRSTGIDATQLTDALKATAFFSVGERDAPAVYMVADPQCPFCHEAWKRLAPKVANREIQLRVIMIAGLRGSEEMARSIISREDPGKAWLAGEGSVAGVRVKDGPLPNSEEWNEAGRWIEMNGLFAKRFDIRQTPFVVYVGDDEEVYFSLGLPADVDDFLSAI